MRRKVSRSKIEKANVLQDVPFISPHIPKTLWYTAQNFWKLVNEFSVVYLKPDIGSLGIGIVRAKKQAENSYELTFGDSSLTVTGAEVISTLKTIMPAKRRYILQQGIDLATYKDCPFDIRMVMQKTNTLWLLTLTSAKVAPREDAIVTNVARGAKDYPLQDILQEYDQKQDPLVAMRELVDLAHRIAGVLGSKFPLNILGLDIALDKQGRIWFLEANIRPQCRQCSLVNDEISRQKYAEARER